MITRRVPSESVLIALAFGLYVQSNWHQVVCRWPLFYFILNQKNIKLINNYSNIIKTQKVEKKKEKKLITFWTSRGLLRMKLPEVSFVRIGQIPRLSPPERVFKLIYYTIQEGGRRDGFRFGWKFDKTFAF